MAVAPRFHWLRLRATAHATEDPDRVRVALATAAGIALEDLTALLEESPIESHYGGTVHLLEATVKRARDIRSILGRLTAADRAELAAALDARVDDDGVLYWRLDKQRAYQGELVLTRGDDAIQCRLKAEVHPATREGALTAFRAWLDPSVQ
jgi:RNA-binding protein